MKPQYITTDAELAQLEQTLTQNRVQRIALDIEGEFNLHHYGMHLCLVQISDGTTISLVDPMALSDPQRLQSLFTNPAIHKITFAASSDLSLLWRTHRLRLAPLVDLSIAVDILGIDGRSLPAVTQRYLGVEPKTKKEFQRADWTRRPLSAGMLEYAADDVRYLLELEPVIIAQLRAQNADAVDAFTRKNRALETKDFSSVDQQPHLRLPGARNLQGPREQLLYRLWLAREIQAQRLDKPPFMIVANPTLVDIAKRPNQAAAEIRRVLEAHHRLGPLDTELFVRAVESADNLPELEALQRYGK